MSDYKKFQVKYYEDEWEKIELINTPGATGWRTTVPAPDFFNFIKWLKKEKIFGKALDIGCGGGRHSIVLAKKGFEVYGIDFSQSAINIAKDNVKKADVIDKIFFQVGNILNLPYEDDFFDVINDDGCLHHISKVDWSTYLQNIKRVLKNGGILRVKVFSKNCNFYKENKSNKNENHWILIPDGDYTYFFNKKEIHELFKDFEIVKIEEKHHPVTMDKKFFFVILRKIR